MKGTLKVNSPRITFTDYLLSISINNGRNVVVIVVKAASDNLRWSPPHIHNKNNDKNKEWKQLQICLYSYCMRAVIKGISA